MDKTKYNRVAADASQLQMFADEVCDEINAGGGGSKVAAPYKLKQFELDLDNMEFSCSAADAEYIFQNNPVAISLDGVVALARDFTDDESKHDYARSYTFFEFPDDDQVIYYELGIYFDGEEYDSDVKPTDPIGGGGGGITVPTFTPTTFDIDLPSVDIALSSQDCADIIQNQYPIINIRHFASETEAISLTFARNNTVSGIEKGEPFTNLQYDLIVDDDEDVYLVGLSFSDNDMKSWSMQINGGGSGETGATKGEFDISGNSDQWTQAQLQDIFEHQYDVISITTSELVLTIHKVVELSSINQVAYMGFSPNSAGITGWSFYHDAESEPHYGVMDNVLAPIVTGRNDGTNWTELTIGEDTYAIPQGGGGGGSDEIYPIAIVATPSSTNIELAAAQNLTLTAMPDAPGYTFAAYTLNAGLSYDKPYDAVLAEFGPGHQYLLPLISKDSSMLMYGIEESGMPVFDDDHPCAILIQLNGSNIDGAMMVSGGTYGPDGTLVATSLKGYFYSDTEFSFNAGGIRDTDVANAIANGRLPVAIIEWKYKDYQSWCPIKSFDEEDYYFEGEYKENKFTLVCDGSYWKNEWAAPVVKDVELIADVDYANNKVYFRSLNNLREAQENNKMLRLKLYDYTSHDYLGNLQFTLASQSSDGTINRYTSTELVNGDVKIKTLVISSTDTLPGGSAIYVQENEYYDFDEADMTNQTKLAEFYNLCPMTLRAHTVHDGLQMYRLQNDYRTEDNQIIYCCLLFGSLVEMTLTENSGTYSIGVVRYGLSTNS